MTSGDLLSSERIVPLVVESLRNAACGAIEFSCGVASVAPRPTPFLSAFIPGNLPRKSNDREIVHAKTAGKFDVVTQGGRTKVVAAEKGSYKVRSKKSPQAQQYVDDFCRLLPGYVKKRYPGPVALSAVVAYRSVHRLPDIELLP